jgi:Ca-activated chloride channel family protein
MPVISARMAASLRAGAERTGGIYVDGNRADAAMILAEYVNSLTAESRLIGHRREANPRRHIFVLIAIACLSGMRIMGYGRRYPPQKRIPQKRRKAEIALICLILFSSCTRTQGRLLIMEGNFFNARGFYTEAISSYLKAQNLEAPYAEYGLASAYFALEEGAAAMERYREAEKGLALSQQDHPELRYRIHYNTGIIYFEQGEYDMAALAFREALKVDGSRIEAKRNLELSILSAARNPPAALFQGEEDREGSEGSASILFEYLRIKEQEQWRSREWTVEGDFSGLDY